jgi:hypothetical protein
MGEPAAFRKVNGAKRQSQAPGLRPGETKISPEQFWTEFWTERLQALKRHMEETCGGSDAENGG